MPPDPVAEGKPVIDGRGETAGVQVGRGHRMPGRSQPAGDGKHRRPPTVHRMKQHDMGHLLIIPAMLRAAYRERVSLEWEQVVVDAGLIFVPVPEAKRSKNRFVRHRLCPDGDEQRRYGPEAATVRRSDAGPS